MLREYIRNIRVLGAFGFLIVLSVVCVLWYRYDTTPYKQQLAKIDIIRIAEYTELTL